MLHRAPERTDQDKLLLSRLKDKPHRLTAYHNKQYNIEDEEQAVSEWKDTVSELCRIMDADTFKSLITALMPCIFRTEDLDAALQKEDIPDNCIDEGTFNADRYFQQRVAVNKSGKNQANHQDFLTGCWMIVGYAKENPAFAADIDFSNGPIAHYVSKVLIACGGKSVCIEHKVDDMEEEFDVRFCTEIDIEGATFDIRKVATALEKLGSR